MSRVMQGDRQDWDPVVIRKKKPTAAQSQSSGAVNAVPPPPLTDRVVASATWSACLLPEARPMTVLAICRRSGAAQASTR